MPEVDKPFRNQPAAAAPIVTVSGLSKTYAGGLRALKHIDLTISAGEIFALLGPNGAGKTTLINIICGIVTPSEGTVVADGHDIVRDYRAARSKIGLVPQELHTDAFESVWATVNIQSRPLRQGAESSPLRRRCCGSCRCGTRRTPRS